MNAEVRIKQAARCVVLSCWTIAFLSLSLVAQTPQLVITKHGPVVQQAAGPDPGLQTIFSNLGSKNDAYDDGVAYQISGPENPLWGKSFLAMPFTPKKDCTLKEVLIALSYLGSGDNKGVVSIYNDAKGAPGKEIKIWQGKNFPPDGKCCKLVAFKGAVGLPLKGGSRYWLVARTDKNSQNGTYDWNFVWNDASGKLAFLNSHTNYQWLPYKDNLSAFGVYGTIP